MKKIALFVASVFLGNTLALAQAQDGLSPVPTPDTVVEVVTPASAGVQIAAESFEDWVANFERQFQKIGVASDGKAFFSGQAAVSVGPQDPNFGKQLALAYEKAMFDMRADFILETYGRMKVKTVRDLFEDQSSNKDDFDPAELPKSLEFGDNRLGALLDKAITLMDKKLDQELVASGVPAEQLNRMSVEQKKTTYKDNLSKEMVKAAFRSMQGLVPVQTRIFTTESGTGKAVVVGVIAVQSQKTRQFALDMSRKRPSQVKGEPKKLADILPAEKEGYLNEIGLRFTYDDTGRPMLLSYGRSSVAIAPDWQPSRTLRAKQNAKEIARSLAESNIVEFMNTNVQVQSTTLVGQQEEELLTRVTNFENGSSTGAEQSHQQLAETINKFVQSGTSTAQADLRGTSRVASWEVSDQGVVHVGTVVAWTYGQLANANAIEAQGTGRAAGGGSAGANAGTDQSRSSRVVNKMSDF